MMFTWNQHPCQSRETSRLLGWTRKEQRIPIDLDLKKDVGGCLYEGHLQAGDERFTDEKMIASVCDGGLVSKAVLLKK